MGLARWILLCLAVGWLAAEARGQGVLVVDAAGGGDFSDLPEAVGVAPAGSVLIVMPGNYSPFVLTKRMTLMGPASGPKPHVEGTSSVVGVERATFQHLSFRAFSATNVPSELVFDACRFGPLGCVGGTGSLSPSYALSLTRCDAVEVSRSYASNAVGYENSQHAALEAFDSNVRIYDSELLGWTWSVSAGWSCAVPPLVPNPFLYEDGGHGIRAIQSHLEVTGSRLRGGSWTSACMLACFDGKPGNAIRLESSTLRLVPRQAGEVAGPSPNAVAIRALSGSSAWIAGGSFSQGQLAVDATSSIEVRPETALLAVVGPGGQGGVRRPRVWAPLAATGVLAMGLGTGGIHIPGWDGALFVNPAQLFGLWPVVGKGLEDPTTFLLELPADSALLGFSVRLQAFFPNLPGVIDPSLAAATNPARILLDF